MILVIIIILIFVVLVAAGGMSLLGGGYWFYKNRSKSEEEEEKEEKASTQTIIPDDDFGTSPDLDIIPTNTGNTQEVETELPYIEDDDIPSIDFLQEDDDIPSVDTMPEEIPYEEPGYVEPESIELPNEDIIGDNRPKSIPANCPDGYEKKDGVGGLFCYKPCPDDWPGTSSAHHCQHKTIKSTVGSDPKKSIPTGCEDGFVNHLGLCYKLPSSDWEVTSPGFIGKKCPTQVNGQPIKDSKTTCFYDRGIGKPYKLSCPSGQIQRGAECYKKPDEGWDWTTEGGLLVGKICPTEVNGQKINDSGTTCWYDRGVGKPFKLTCPEGKVQKGVECYDKPPSGWDWTTPGGLLIGKVCPKEVSGQKINDSGTTCWYDRGAGETFKLKCPDGQVQRGVECYKKPDPGWDWTTQGGLLVGKVCPKQVEGQNINDSGTTCWYDRGVGTIPTTKCPSGQIMRGGGCYPNPKSGYTWVSGALTETRIGKTCPSGSRQLVETCHYDRGVGKLKNQCPSGSVAKSQGCYNNPPSGYNWFSGAYTENRIAEDCKRHGSDVNNLATTCHYDRGAGRIPNKRPCSYWNGSWRDDGTSCWSDAHIFGKYYSAGWNGSCRSGYRKICHGICGASVVGCQMDSCPSGYNNDGATCRKIDVGIKKTLFQRQYCNWDEELIDGLCYKKPKPGFRCVATSCSKSRDVRTGPYRSPHQCPSGTVWEQGMCYTPARPGFNCTVTSCSMSRDVQENTKLGNPYKACDDPNRILDIGMCYKKPVSGFNCDVTHCKTSKGVKPGTKLGTTIQYCENPNKVLDDGMCYNKPLSGFNCSATQCNFSKGVKGGTKSGTTKQTCTDSDRVLDDGMCYKKPISDQFKCTVTNCGFSKEVKGGTRVGLAPRSCEDPDRILTDEMCYKKPIDSKFKCRATVCDFSKEIKTQTGLLPSKCPDNRELVGRLCYPPCLDGYERRGDNLEFCSTKCPTDYKNIGIGGCEKPKLELIKAGVCPEGYKKDGARCVR